MQGDRNPSAVNHTPIPGVKAFALLSALESSARGILISVLPVAMYRAFGDAKLVSEVYFLIGLCSLLVALIIPGLGRYIPRRWLYTIAVVTFIVGTFVGMFAETWVLAIGLAMMTLAVVVITICFNAYVMDYISRSRLKESETLRLFYSGAAWTIGPFLGIWLMGMWKPAPFILSALAASILLIVFWVLRLGNGKAIHKAKTVPANSSAYLYRFIRQPRLVAGWTFSVIRSCGWWVYVVYLPIYAVEHGYSEQLGGILLSASNAFLFLAPMMSKFMRGRIRKTLVFGFCAAGTLFMLASFDIAGYSVAMAFLVAASMFLVLLDLSAGLPFLMAVRPSERTEMSAVYSSFRDVSAVLTPGVASVLLIFAPLQIMFSVTALSFYGCAYLATKLHPRLGTKDIKPVVADELVAEI